MKRSTLAGSLATLTLLISACGGGGTEGESDSPSALRIGMTTEGGGNYDPVTNPNPFATGYLKPVFDTLLTKDASGAFAAGLAKSYKADPAGKTVTLTLRDKVTFHDGTPLDAKAVVANLERARTASDSVLKGELATVTEVRAVDASTVEIKLSGGVGAFLGSLTGRVGMMGSPAKMEGKGYANKPVGTGPWAVSGESVVGQRMVYTAYDGYWDKSVQTVDRIELKLVTAESMHSALLGDEIDVGSLEGRRDMISKLEQSGFTREVFPKVAYQQILYLRKEGPLADAKVRQAISRGLDRADLNKQVMESACTPQAGVQALPGADDIDTPTRDADAARKLLAEAGHGDGVDVTVVVSSAGPGSRILQAMQGQLKQVGIQLSIKPMARAQLLSTYVSGKADGYFTVNTGDADPAALVAQLGTTLSPGDFSDKELDKLAARGADSVDPAEREAAYAQWNQRFAETGFGVGLCNVELPYLVRDGVKGLKVGSPLHIDPRSITVS